MSRSCKTIITLWVVLLVVFPAIVCLYLDNNSKLYTVFNCIENVSGIILLVTILTYAASIYFVEQTDNNRFKSYVECNQPVEIIRIETEHLKKYRSNELCLNAKYHLLIAYFMNGENENAIALLENTNWLKREKDVLYFRVLVAIYNNELGYARDCFAKLQKSNRGKHHDQITVCERLLSPTDALIEAEDELIHSIYPIVSRLAQRKGWNHSVNSARDGG